MREKTKLMRMYRKMQKAYNKKHYKIAKIYQKLIRFLFSCEIPCSVVLGENVELKHAGLGVVIHKDAIIGDNTIIMHNVTIGGKNGESCPKIGNNCFIGIGAILLGEIEIGDYARIAANSVVLSDVEPFTLVAGTPAKIIKRYDTN